jgi:hypothetical protein
MNLSILDEVQPRRSLEAIITGLKLRYFGHITRTNGSVERDITLGQVEGYRRQGRPRLRWTDSVKEITGLLLEKLKEIVQDKKKMAHAGGRKD